MKGKPEGTGGGADIKQRDVIEAVLILDDFDGGLAPLSALEPPALYPLVNVPLLEYTLEFLESNNVHQLFIYVRPGHHDILDKYVHSSSRWNEGSKLNIMVMSSVNCSSVGDVLREVDSSSLLKSEVFILLTSLVVANFDLTAVYARFKEFYRANKMNLMMSVFRQMHPDHYARKMTEDIIIAYAPKTSQILSYSYTDVPAAVSGDVCTTPIALSGGASANVPQSHLTLDLAMMDMHGDIEVHRDWTDTHIDVCSREVAALMTENFDYNTMRRDFVRGILSSDILGHMLLAHVITDKYVHAVSSWRDLHVTQKDLMSRWCYPITPSTIKCTPKYAYDYDVRDLVRPVVIPGSSSVSSTISIGEGLLSTPGVTHAHNKFFNDNRCNFGGTLYVERHVRLPRDVFVSGDVVIGPDVVIGAGVKIQSSVIGRNVLIGDGATVENCTIWDDVIISDHAHLRDVIVCNGAKIFRGVNVGSGCIIGPGLEINRSVVPCQRLLRPVQIDEDVLEEIEFEQLPNDVVLWLGFKPPEGFGADSVRVVSVSNSRRELIDVRFRDDTWYSLGCSSDGKMVMMNSKCNDNVVTISEEESNEGEIDLALPKRIKQTDKVLVDEEPEDEEGATKRDLFCNDASDTLERGFSTGIDVDTLAMELNALKLSHNTSLQDVASVILYQILSRAMTTADVNVNATAAADITADRKKLLKSMSKLLKQWKRLMAKFCSNKEDHVELLYSLEKLPYLGDKHFRYLLQVLYDADYVHEDAIYEWSDTNTPENPLLVQAKPFIDWLKEAEEEDDDDDV